MKSSLGYKFLLVCSAYAPLFLILFIKLFDFTSFYYALQYYETTGMKYLFDFKDHNDWLAASSLLMFLLSIFSAFYIKNEMDQTIDLGLARLDVQVYELASRDKDALVYLVTYLLPLISLNISTVRDVIVLVILLSLIFWLSIYSDLLYVNPTLFILGKRLFDVNTSKGKYLLIVNKNDSENIIEGNKLVCYRLDTKKILVSKGDVLNE